MTTIISTDQNCARSGLQPLFTIVDLERLLQVTGRTISRWCERGEFPRPFKIGGSNRWRPEDVEGVISRLAVETQPGHAVTWNGVSMSLEIGD